MIDKNVYTIEHIRQLQQKYNTDPGLLERAVYAFGLLEALRSVGMQFCFKGGTSLLLLLDKPARLSTDIDVLVEPETDVDGYIEKAAEIFPFLDKHEDIRKGKNDIVKRHFKFTYLSPVRKTEFYVLLDVVFAPLPYAKTIQKEIKNELLLNSGDNQTVTIPTIDCILGDKLAAFAPHTTGVLLGFGKELEIAKQLFDTSTLSEYLSDFELLCQTYNTVVKDEASYRGEKWDTEDVLRDTIRACACIISRGTIDRDDYTQYLTGIKSLKNHVLSNDYNTDDAPWRACRIMYLASCLLSGNPYQKIENHEKYVSARLEVDAYKRLAYVRKQRLDAYGYLVDATRNLREFLR